MRGPFVLVEGVMIAYDSPRPLSLLSLVPSLEDSMRATIQYCVV